MESGFELRTVKEAEGGCDGADICAHGTGPKEEGRWCSVRCNKHSGMSLGAGEKAMQYVLLSCDASMKMAGAVVLAVLLLGSGNVAGFLSSVELRLVGSASGGGVAVRRASSSRK